LIASWLAQKSLASYTRKMFLSFGDEFHEAVQPTSGSHRGRSPAGQALDLDADQ
jgi:hypothetical protein